MFLSLFDDNPELKRIFCPPKECYDPELNRDGRYGVPLPAFSELIETGRVVALNFPISANPATARAIGCMLKQDFQRAMLGRIPQMAQNPATHFREALFLCDEYQAFATVGESDPSGDEKFFALSRQAKCIPIVATQSISSLRSTLPGESWRTYLSDCVRAVEECAGDRLGLRRDGPATAHAGVFETLVPQPQYRLLRTGGKRPAMSFDLILPFLRPIEHLILDEEVSEIMVNGTGRVFMERAGKIEALPARGDNSGTPAPSRR